MLNQKMDYNENDSILRINKMVDNFRRLCCCEQCTESSSYSTSPRNYTNFSVKQILWQDFRRGLQYDSDGTYMSENSDVYSSCDECERCSSPNMQLSTSPEPLDLSKKYIRFANEESNRWTPNLKPTRTGFQADEDGYSSSDSEVAHALDLRVQRKKTPPKVNSGIPAWVFCTRYSDRPSAGPRARRRRSGVRQPRTRTAFNDFQLEQLNIEFDNDQYLSESRRQRLANELNLNEANVKIWFQNRRAKLKKTGDPRPLALRLQSEGLYNHKPT
ncbi:homeobox protein engrailed-2b-like [Mercenaria mercenaria]|uniref:homeobox protein engrailed-2b-like n=1 Tax=Mercenaria mercenaria TaxID=6596 RepID=UPI00234F83C0|nr:homeobox protein engrailed-2b-like [Mercenaria mercenaria]